MEAVLTRLGYLNHLNGDFEEAAMAFCQQSSNKSKLRKPLGHHH